MDWGALILKLTSECGILGATGWVLFGLVTFRLMQSESKREKLQERMVEDAILGKKTAEASAAAQRELAHAIVDQPHRRSTRVSP